jgi:hypothetical protein
LILLVDGAVLEAMLRANTAFYQGCTDVERLIRRRTERNSNNCGHFRGFLALTTLPSQPPTRA